MSARKLTQHTDYEKPLCWLIWCYVDRLYHFKFISLANITLRVEGLYCKWFCNSLLYKKLKAKPNSSVTQVYIIEFNHPLLWVHVSKRDMQCLFFRMLIQWISFINLVHRHPLIDNQIHFEKFIPASLNQLRFWLKSGVRGAI